MKINLPKLFSQRDGQWANKLLGYNTDASYTIGNYGCLITCLAMVGFYFGKDENPDSINTKLKSVNGFQNGGLYVWQSFKKIYGDISEVKTDTPSLLTDAQINEIKSGIDKGYPIMLQIDFVPETAPADTHYVLVCDYNPSDENDFTIADPWTGSYKSLKEYLRGVKPTARKTIEQYIVYGGTPKPAVTYSGDILVGNDISEHQGDIDWNTYKNNTNFVIIRSTYGDGYTDLKYSRNKDEARKAGLPVGFYHYAYPQYNTPEKEAEWFLMQVSDIREGEVLILDFEEAWSGDVVGWCKKFLDTIQAKRDGYKGLIYLNQSQCKQYDWKPLIDVGYKLWIAAYTYDPRNNTYSIGAWQSAVMQQWTNKQSVPGIANAVDGNVFFGKRENFIALGYKKPATQQPSVDYKALYEALLISKEALQQQYNSLLIAKQQVEIQRDAYKIEYDKANASDGYKVQIEHLETYKKNCIIETAKINADLTKKTNQLNNLRKSGLKFIQYAVIKICDKLGIDLS